MHLQLMLFLRRFTSKNARIMPDFASVYDPLFPHRPARSMVEVSNLPARVDIQVDFIAVI